MNHYLFLSVFFVWCARGEAAITGKVLETMDSGGYTYAKVAQASGPVWVAVTKMPLKAGDAVSFTDGMVMKDFRSETLNRTFKNIVFSQGPVSAQMPAGHGVKSSSAKHSGAVSLSQDSSAKTAKAEGPDAATVEEVFTRRKELAGKTVSVRGKVVKFSPEIMGRNWVHLQDGSGNAKSGTHDLLITTSEKVTVGQTVTARGTAAVDQNFGAGYKYQVLLEKASLKR